MSLEKISVLLEHADKHGYALGAFNGWNYESAAWVIQAAQQERVPVIVQIWPGFDTYIPLGTFAAMAKDLAQRAAVPVGLQADHSHSFEQARHCAASGYPCVMIDGSSLPLAQNIDVTSRVVTLARGLGIEVEAELGHVGSAQRTEDYLRSDHYTQPDQARQFIERTRADALAVAIGSAHGMYVERPRLDIERLRQINRLVSTPLVLHGGSGIPDDQLQAAVEGGINKVNFATEIAKLFQESLTHALNHEKLGRSIYSALEACREPVVNLIRKKIRVLNPHARTL